MGQDTNIEWAHHTFNPWEGCIKVSPACKNCYAETRAVRFGHSNGGKHLPLWGPGSRRKFRSESYWKQPLKWNREAEAAGERRRVFCMSLGDFFELLPNDHPDSDQMTTERQRVFDMMEATPWLDWLLLTKRPEHVLGMVEVMPTNAWLGVTVENQETANARIPQLLDVPATVHFLSCEPVLGPIDLKRVTWARAPYGHVDVLRGGAWSDTNWGFVNHSDMATIDWVIGGGESGPDARPSNPDWFRSLRDQCAESGADVPFLFKQWGAWCPADQLPPESVGMLKAHPATGDHFRWDSSVGVQPPGMPRPGKKLSGRLLDGVEHNGFPVAAAS